MKIEARPLARNEMYRGWTLRPFRAGCLEWVEDISVVLKVLVRVLDPGVPRVIFYHFTYLVLCGGVADQLKGTPNCTRSVPCFVPSCPELKVPLSTSAHCSRKPFRGLGSRFPSVGKAVSVLKAPIADSMNVNDDLRACLLHLALSLEKLDFGDARSPPVNIPSHLSTLSTRHY